jgi:hypothetical protein
MPKKVSRGTPKERSDRAVSTPRRSGVRPTSVHLTPEENAALTSEAKKRNVSRSALIHDDVVTLANLVVGLGYVVETLDERISRNRRAEARAQLADAIEKLQRIAGRGTS